MVKWKCVLCDAKCETEVKTADSAEERSVLHLPSFFLSFLANPSPL